MNEVSFATQKLCNFIKVHLLIVGLISRVTRALRRRSLSEPIPYSFFQDCQSFRSNIENFLIYLELICVQGERERSSSILLHVDTPFLQLKGKDAVLSLMYVFAIFVNKYLWVQGLIFGPLILFHCLFLYRYHAVVLTIMVL